MTLVTTAILNPIDAKPIPPLLDLSNQLLNGLLKLGIVRFGVLTIMLSAAVPCLGSICWRRWLNCHLLHEDHASLLDLLKVRSIEIRFITHCSVIAERFFNLSCYSRNLTYAEILGVRKYAGYQSRQGTAKRKVVFHELEKVREGDAYHSSMNL